MHFSFLGTCKAFSQFIVYMLHQFLSLAMAPTGSVSLILHWWNTFFYVWLIKTAQKMLQFTGNTRRFTLLFWYSCTCHTNLIIGETDCVTEFWSGTWQKIFKVLILEERPISFTFISIFILFYRCTVHSDIQDVTGGRDQTSGVFLRSYYTNITQNTYIQSSMVTEILAREVWNIDSYYSLIDYQIHTETGRNMWFL